MVRDDITGICKFSNLDGQRLTQAISLLTGINISEDEIKTTVRHAFLRGIWLEKKQGFNDSDYELPAEILKMQNENVKTPSFLTEKYLKELKKRVFSHFDEEIKKLCA